MYQGRPLEYPFEVGDRLGCFSDGCFENIGERSDFRLAHFQEMLGRHRHLPLVEARREIVAEHKSLRADAPLEDDVTLVMIDRL